MHLVLAGVLAAILSASLISQQRVSRVLAERAATAAAVRTAVAVLAGEARFLDPAGDVLGVASDTISLRAVRGIGIVCELTEGDGDGTIVRYRGMREPDAGKDRVIPAAGDLAPAELRRSSPAAGGEGCVAGDGEALYRWTLDTVPPAGTLLVLYETGSYHLAEDLRYRRGGAGRQPITSARFDTIGTRMEPVASAPPDPSRIHAHAGSAGRDSDGGARSIGSPDASLSALRITIAPQSVPSGSEPDTATREISTVVPFINASPAREPSRNQEGPRW